MAPPSVLGSDARSASLANTGCGFPIGTSLALAAETGTTGTEGPDVPFSPDGGTAWAGVGWPCVVSGSKAWMCAAGPLAPGPGIPLAPGVRLGEAGRRSDGCAWNLRGQSIDSEHRRRRQAGARACETLDRQTPEQRVGDRGDPGGIWRLTFRRRGTFQVATKRQRPGRPAGADGHRPRSRKLRHDDPRESLATFAMPSDRTSVTTACASLHETRWQPPRRPCRKCGHKRDTCPPRHYRARRAHPRSARRASCKVTRGKTRSPCG